MKGLKTIALLQAILVSLSFLAFVPQSFATNTNASPKIQYIYISKNVTINRYVWGHVNAGWVVPDCTLDVTIDTDADLWTLKWDGSWYIIAPLPAGPFGFHWEVYDQKGFNASGASGPSGSISLNYPNTNTWCTTTMKWSYTAGVYYIFVTLVVTLCVIDLGRRMYGGGAAHCYFK